MKMLSVLLTVLLSVLISVLLSVQQVSCQADCPCELRNSTIYEAMFVWDCTGLGLTDVPDDCITIKSKNVSEMILSGNRITTIRSTTLAELTDIRVLSLEYNELSFVDLTALEFMRRIEVINFNHNLDLRLDVDIYAGLELLNRITTIGTNQVTLPNIAISPVLNFVDVRSSQLTSLPKELLHPELSSTSFYLNVHGNDITDIAAVSLLGLPDDTILNVDTHVLFWARTEDERIAFISKPWTVNINLTFSTHLCGGELIPSDQTVCQFNK